MTRNLWTTTIIIFILSTVGMSLWLYEILEIQGWYNLNWADNGALYSPYIAALLVVFAFIVPFIISKQATAYKILLPSIILYAVNMICFKIGEYLCHKMLSFWFVPMPISDIILGFSLFILIGFFYWLITHKLIKRNKKINIIFITLLAILIIPLSSLTIEINSGFGSQRGWVDTVKMGYPIFWTTMLLGVGGILIARQKNLIRTDTQ